MKSSEPPKKQWICVDLACSQRHADDLGAMIAEAFTIAVEITATGVRFYLDASQVTGAWEAALRQVLEQFTQIFGPEGPLTYASHPTHDEGWADRWKEHFKPLRVGHHFIVCPTWEEPQAGPRDWVIRIDPGRAFGTGHHETTRLCLEWLDDAAFSQRQLQASLLDVGTGTGILAIGAALAGWRAVVALDTDPEAIEIAAENVSLNHVAQRVRVALGTVHDDTGQFAVVLANIQAAPLIEMAATLTRRLQPGGRLVLSGILSEQQETVRAAYQGHGLRRTRQRTAGEWCLLEFAGNPAHPPGCSG
jgi:ribosomal protein L11 methyltransferase